LKECEEDDKDEIDCMPHEAKMHLHDEKEISSMDDGDECVEEEEVPFGCKSE
jgi:hypothetical protein